jgi:hypothetical protein
MNLIFRCMFRWIVGMVLGLMPALVYYLYAQATQVMHDDVYFSRLTLALEAGLAAGAITGAIWAARLAITAYEEGGARRRIGGP